MLKRVKNGRGASMLLAICIFMFLAVLGFNVLAAVQANVSNTAEEAEYEAGIQLANSFFEITNKAVCNGAFVVDGYIADVSDISNNQEPFVKTEAVPNLSGENLAETKVSLEFLYYKSNEEDDHYTSNKMRVRSSVEYSGKTYSVSAVYEMDAANSLSGKVKYKVNSIEGVQVYEQTL